MQNVTLPRLFTCINRNDGAENSEMQPHWETNIPKVTMLADLTTTAKHDVKDK